MSRFWGFPMGLIALPMVAAKAKENRSILAEIISSQQNW